MSQSAAAQPKFHGARSHPLWIEVGSACDRNPRQAAALFQAYSDLKLAAGWRSLSVAQLTDDKSACSWGSIRGMRKDQDKAEYVIPISIADSLTAQDFQTVYKGIDRVESQRSLHSEPAAENGHFILAVASNDSTVVYYKLAKGLVKPVN